MNLAPLAPPYCRACWWLVDVKKGWNNDEPAVRFCGHPTRTGQPFLGKDCKVWGDRASAIPGKESMTLTDDRRPLEKSEVLRRVNVLREANQMSRTEFGKLVQVKFQGPHVCISTTKHDAWITKEAWEALGELQV